MQTRFPHLKAAGNESTFPDLGNVQTYRYDNGFDYARFDDMQMRVIMCKVPWDMGEAHVGNRTISGIGNVVHFGSEGERDNWFASLSDSECYRFDTKYRALHRDNEIVVPVPFDVASRYNYIAVYYADMASDGSRVEYEDGTGLQSWFWFIREVEFLAPNSTRLHLLNDAWQTFIYRVNIPWMMLERGHAAMTVNASTYLQNPVERCGNLLAPEPFEPGEARISKRTYDFAFQQGDIYAVVVTSANPHGAWGSKSSNTWQTPANQPYTQGVPSYHAFAMRAGNLSSFLANVNSTMPQFLQTVACICFASSQLLTLRSMFTFCGTTCYEIASGYRAMKVQQLSKNDFGYPRKYSEIAKLYTFPYAHLVLSDEQGNQTLVRIEDTDGSVTVDYCMSLAYPWLNVTAQVSSIGRASRKSIQFGTATDRNMPISGNWYDYIMKWDIPTFGVVEAASTYNDHATHFDRIQQAHAADNAKANADANANMVLANANASADTALANEKATQAGLVANKEDAKDLADLKIDTITDGGSITQIGGSGGYIADTYGATLDKLSDDNDADQILMYQQTQLSNDVVAASAVVNAGGSIAGGITSGASNGAAFGVPGAVAGGVLGGVASGVTASAGTMITITNNNNMVANNILHSNAKFRNARNNAMAIANAQIAYNHAIKDADNDYQDSTVDRFSATGGINNTNAERSNTTQKANAARANSTTLGNDVRDRETVSSAIDNQIAQAALQEPQVFGAFNSGDVATTRAQGLYSTIVTQDDYTVRRCGDEFTRYGYTLGTSWEFDGNWCPMKRFCYWKLSDFVVNGLDVPDMYMDKLRFFLFGGVTVWKDPEYIGKYFDNL